MSTELCTLARSKLSSSTSGTSCSLHRWVLLKNSIVRAPSCTPCTSSQEILAHDDDDFEESESDTFMFPDVAKFGPATDSSEAESQWLDSLLEELGDDDDDYLSVSSLPVDDDEDTLLSPLSSPMSSSDDLTYYNSHAHVPYSPAYPFRSQLLLSYPFDCTTHTALPNDPLPYYNLDDDEVPPVPDAIDDTSDDESDSPATPSLRGSHSSLSPSDPASIPLPTARNSCLRHMQPHIYVGADGSHYNPFDHFPLPFPDDDHIAYNPYRQEC